VTEGTSRSVSRRTALAGLALGVGAAVGGGERGTAQDATPAAGGDLGSHPIVGLWQFDASLDPALGPLPTFELFHGDGTYTSWGGPDAGTTLGLWRPTGDRTAEVLKIATETDAFPGTGPQPGTVTIQVTAEVNADGTGLTYGVGSFDVRDVVGTVQYASEEMHFPPSTRVSFARNPMTGSTVVEGTPPGGTPSS
jgi:hypothetical protein